MLQNFTKSLQFAWILWYDQSKHRWEDNIGMDFKDTGAGRVDRIGLVSVFCEYLVFHYSKEFLEQMNDSTFEGIPCTMDLMSLCYRILRVNL
jgi:hypothetical protein